MSYPVKILLVEDNPADIKLTMLALQKSKLTNQIEVVKDGEEALAYLYKQGQYVLAERPDLILLDLNLPKRSGHEVLEEIKMDSNLKTIPVVVLTSSDDEHDIFKSYNNYANCYITKPVGLPAFLEIVKGIEDFWFTIVKLPKGTTSPSQEA